MLHPEAIDPYALELLRQLQADPFLGETRLVGGTALALQLGHRKSNDLDLFGRLPGDTLDLDAALRTYGVVSLVHRGRLVQVYSVNGIKLDVVEYPYPWLDDPVTTEGLRLASFRDIAALKLAAITNRGTRKDFVDLVFLLDQFALPELLTFYSRKYADSSLFPVLKSLTYFDDAEDDPMPTMLRPCDWVQTKERIVAAVAEVSVG